MKRKEVTRFSEFREKRGLSKHTGRCREVAIMRREGCQKVTNKYSLTSSEQLFSF